MKCDLQHWKVQWKFCESLWRISSNTFF